MHPNFEPKSGDFISENEEWLTSFVTGWDSSGKTLVAGNFGEKTRLAREGVPPLEHATLVQGHDRRMKLPQRRYVPTIVFKIFEGHPQDIHGEGLRKFSSVLRV